MAYSDSIDGRMFDFENVYDTISKELPDNSIIAEVGVANGKSALYLAEKLKEQEKDFTLYMVDNLAYGGQEQLTEIIKNVQLSGLGESIRILPMDSLNASCKFNDGSLDFVFLDSSHTYSMTKAEILLWTRKIKDNGKLYGHDYNEHDGKGVKDAVDELIPITITRPPLEDQETVFEPEPLLKTISTRNSCGVWGFEKKDYFNFKM